MEYIFDALSAEVARQCMAEWDAYRSEYRGTRADELERALFTERVRALDVLADPTDLPFSAELLDDPDALRDAVDSLVSSRPHYRRRGVATGTGSREEHAGPGVSLLGLMRGGA